MKKRETQTKKLTLEARDQAVADAVRQRIIARGHEYAKNLRTGGYNTSAIEGFLMVLEVEPNKPHD